MLKRILAILTLCGLVMSNAVKVQAGDKCSCVCQCNTKQSSVLPATVLDWQDLYAKEFGIKVDLKSMVLPPQRQGFDRLLVIVPGVTAQKAYDACAKYFKVWKYSDRSLDELVPINDRAATTKPYAIWVRDRQEADEELKGLSANDLKKRGISGETLTERLIHELKYFLETGNHLDVVNITLVSGSRVSDGSVPFVDWSGFYGELRVYWYSPGYTYDGLRSRVAVSVP